MINRGFRGSSPRSYLQHCAETSPAAPSTELLSPGSTWCHGAYSASRFVALLSAQTHKHADVSSVPSELPSDSALPIGANHSGAGALRRDLLGSSYRPAAGADPLLRLSFPFGNLSRTVHSCQTSLRIHGTVRDPIRAETWTGWR